MRKYISLIIIEATLIAMLISVFALGIIIHPLGWICIVIVLAISTVMYSRGIDAENREEQE